MNENTLIDAISNIDESMIEKHIKMRALSDAGMRGRQKSRVWIKWVSLAACLALIVSAIPLWALMKDGRPIASPGIPDYVLPTYDDAYFSVDDIRELFGGQLSSGGTHYYNTKCVPDPSYLYLAEIPGTEYLPVYEQTCLPIDTESFRALVDERLPLIADALGIQVPEYEILGSEDDELNFFVNVDDYRIDFDQRFRINRVSIDKMSANTQIDEDALVLNGKIATVDRTKSDEGIILSLTDFLSEIQMMLGTDFPDVKVVREYYELEDYNYDVGAYGLTVYLYDASAHPLNDYSLSGEHGPWPYSDWVQVHFTCLYNENVMYNDSINYWQFREDVTEITIPTVNAKRISLETAEKLLAAGFVFGGHSCSVCGRHERAVDFTDYDLVGLTYIYDLPSSNPDWGYSKLAVPFYVFSKRIGRMSSGNLIYAQIYVPAIEVSGIEEYIRIQKEFHNR